LSGRLAIVFAERWREEETPIEPTKELAANLIEEFLRSLRESS
jgi:hypothetical protein